MPKDFRKEKSSVSVCLRQRGFTYIKKFSVTKDSFAESKLGINNLMMSSTTRDSWVTLGNFTLNTFFKE